jgi:hypothetical protein
VPQRLDPGFQLPDVHGLATARERPLIVCGLGDRTRDPRRRQCRQLPLTRAQVSAVCSRPSAQRTLRSREASAPWILTDRTQHHLVLGREVPQTVPGPPPRKARAPQRTLPTLGSHPPHHPCPQGRTPATQPDEQQPPRSPIRPQNPRSHPANNPAELTHAHHYSLQLSKPTAAHNPRAARTWLGRPPACRGPSGHRCLHRHPRPGQRSARTAGAQPVDWRHP